MENMIPLSRVEAILMGEPVSIPQSRVEYLLQELVDKMNELANTEIYKAKGSILFVDLPTPAASNDGWVYDVTDDFITDSRFKTGAGQAYPGGTNVVIINTGTEETPIYKYDVLGGFVNMDLYVQKEAGKGLSTNDYTDVEKTKLSGIAEGAEVNAQSDWNESDNSSDAYIQNKPTLGTASALNVAESGNAGDNEVVKGNDSRLTDDRNPTPHTHTTSQITDFPALGTAAGLNVPATGDASSSEVVKGDDSRVVNSPIADSVSGINPSITDSADGLVQDVTVYGRSDVSKNIWNDDVTTYSPGITRNDHEYTLEPFESSIETLVFSKTFSGSNTYTFSFEGKSESDGTVIRFDGQPDGVSGLGVDKAVVLTTAYTRYSFSGDVDSTYNALRFYRTLSNVGHDKSINIRNIQLELGSKPTPYEPYFSGIHGIGDEDGELEVETCGKNLIPSWASGYINTADGKTVEPNLYWTYTPNYIALDNNRDYVISADITNRAALFYYDANKNFISVSTGIMTSSKQYVITTKPVGTKYIRLGFNVSGASVPITSESMPTYKVQLELGSTATAYEPYVSTTATLTTGLPLYSVGDVKDELDEKKGIVVKRCEKVVFDGSEEWTHASSPNERNSAIMSTVITRAITPHSNEVQGHLISMLDNLSALGIFSELSDNSICIGNEVSYQNAFIRINGVFTATDLKTYLASNPVTAIYELATPYELPLASAELSALRNLRTYAPTTNVAVTDDPTSTVGYLLNTDNGQAVADVQQGLQGQISNIPAWLTSIPENHKNIYRGKYLGNSVSAAQLAAVADGSFDDLYVGDYWEIPVTIDGTTVSNKWRIADFDYFLHNGTDKHHAVIVPDNTLYTASIGGNTSYGYYQSTMFTTNLNKGRTAIANAFPDMVISYKYTDVIGQVVTKYDCTVELMALSSLTGVYSDYVHTNYLPVLPQMSLFRIMPDFIGANPNGSGHDAGFLTQTVQSSSFYWAISTAMSMMRMSTSDSYGVRPFFLLGDASNI